MSASRVEGADDMVVDGSGVDPPTNEWLQRAQRAAESETDGSECLYSYIACLCKCVRVQANDE